MDRASQHRYWHSELERAFTSRGRETSGRFVIEGWRLHQRALRAGWVPDAVFVDAAMRSASDERVQILLGKLQQLGVPVMDLESASTETLTGGRKEGGLLGLMPLPRATTLDELLEAAPVRLLVCSDIEDPGNAGALVRTALAAGASAVIALGASDPFHPRAVRISRGSLFRIPIVCYQNAATLIEELKQRRVVQLGTTPRDGSLLPDLGQVAPPWALWVGSEARGLPPEILNRLDQRLTIPMADDVDSFSVHAAAAIALYALIQVSD